MISTTTSQTCATCRARKVRCDGMKPMCGPCSKARRAVECVYINPGTSSVAKASFLQKGAACYPCRRKKKKCDAKRPCCSTCKTAGKEDSCEYEDNVQRTLTEALIGRTHELEQKLAEYERRESSMMAQASSSTTASEGTYSISSMAELNEFMAAIIPNSHSAASNLSLELESISGMLPNYPSIGPLPGPSRAITSAPFKSASEIISPLLTAHYLASPITLQTFDEFRMVFLAHHAQLGVGLPEQKVRAIMAGDISGTVVDPVLVYTAQLMGCRIWQEQRRTTACNPIEAMQLEAVRQSLAMTQTPVTRLQVLCNLAIYFFNKREMHEGRDHLLQAARTIAQYNLHFTRGYGDSIPETSDDLQERICALSQFVYLDKDASIVLNDQSLLSKDLDEQFKALPSVFPVISRNVVVLRARSLALLQLARRLSAKWTDMILSTNGQGVPSIQTEWYDEYWALMEDILAHISVISQSMLKSTFFLDREFGLGMKLCMIVSLTASAELHRLLSSYHSESRQKCLDVVLEIMGITKWLKDDDYVFLDPILGTCWIVVASVLMQEHNTPTDEATAIHYRSLLSVILASAAKLGHEIPFMEKFLEHIQATITSDINTFGHL